MNELAMTAIEADPQAAQEALKQVQSAIAQIPELAGFDVTEILRLVPAKRAVFHARRGGEEIILRYLMGARDRADAPAQWQELLRAVKEMRDPAYRINPPVHFNADLGVMALGVMPGAPMMTLMWSQNDAARSDLTRRAAIWLEKYTRPSVEHRGIDRKRWVARAEQAMSRQPHEILRPVETEILKKMKKLGRSLHRQPWRVAVTHGDFHPNNFLVDGGTISGIDLGGAAKLPIYKDVARFLVHCARRDMLPSRARHFGVDAESYDIFAEALNMSAQERDGFLPFMIAFETLFRVEHPQFPTARIAHARAMSEALLADLRDLTAPH